MIYDSPGGSINQQFYLYRITSMAVVVFIVGDYHIASWRWLVISAGWMALTQRLSLTVL